MVKIIKNLSILYILKSSHIIGTQFNEILQTEFLMILAINDSLKYSLSTSVIKFLWAHRGC